MIVHSTCYPFATGPRLKDHVPVGRDDHSLQLEVLDEAVADSLSWQGIS